ncbi:MAG TPA: hypothetical protein VG275_07235 [Solirubrobacteraceae bacterium]|jgi:hypothetical protein|nr:hypothetical protein [Solirubrobacteraceae bacterium]
MTPLPREGAGTPDHDAARAKAGESAARVLDILDDEVMAAHEEASVAMIAYGTMLARRGLDPAGVLGQMQSVVANAFVERLMPNWTRRSG